MPASELLKFVKTVCRQKAKGQSVEVKSAHVDGPRQLYDTLSSFSSQDSGDIKTKRSQCGEVIKEYSWKMVYAEDENTFKSLWQEMKDKIKGFGYDEVLAYDLENLKVIQKATEEALAGN